ncbi:MAG: LysR family transcriptional regulator [Lachnospiraceae bacterium]
MNIQNLRYALEIHKKKSISKAAKSLYVAQPNLSKSIKELEASCGIQIFKRSSRGVEATKEGQAFLEEAEAIIKKLDELKSKYAVSEEQRAELKISIPRASYISHGFTNYVAGKQGAEKLLIHVDETGTVNAIKQVEDQTSSLAVIRYNVRFEEYFQSLFQLKELESRKLLDFSYQLLVSAKSRLLNKEEVLPSDLETCIEVVRGDNVLPNGESVDVSVGNSKTVTQKKIYVYDRASQFDLLIQVENTFMWVAPMPETLLERNGLATIPCSFMDRDMRDVIVFRKGHPFTTEELLFMEELQNVLKESIPEL